MGFIVRLFFGSFKFVFITGYSSLGQWVIAEAKGWSRAVRLIYHPKVVARAPNGSGRVGSSGQVKFYEK